MGLYSELGEMYLMKVAGELTDKEFDACADLLIKEAARTEEERKGISEAIRDLADDARLFNARRSKYKAMKGYLKDSIVGDSLSLMGKGVSGAAGVGKLLARGTGKALGGIGSGAKKGFSALTDHFSTEKKLERALKKQKMEDTLYALSPEGKELRNLLRAKQKKQLMNEIVDLDKEFAKKTKPSFMSRVGDVLTGKRLRDAVNMPKGMPGKSKAVALGLAELGALAGGTGGALYAAKKLHDSTQFLPSDRDYYRK